MYVLSLLLLSLPVFAVLLLSEWGLRRQVLSGEIGRKFVHITVGTYVAFWPFFVDWDAIRLMSLAFFVVVLFAMQLQLFRAIGSVQRPTYGELFFALSVGFVTLLTSSKAIYATAILQMTLADGLAAVIGVRYGRRTVYHIGNQRKSIVGSGTFFAVSLALMVAYDIWADAGLAPGIVIGVALLATALENALSYGLDNFFVPLLIAVYLQHLA